MGKKGFRRKPKEKLTVEFDEEDEDNQLEEDKMQKTINLQMNDEDSDEDDEEGQESDSDQDFESDEDDNDDDDDDDDEEKKNNKSKENSVLFPERNRISEIKNKVRRQEMLLKLLQKKKKEKIKERKHKTNDPNRVKQEPKTIESTREPEDSTVKPDDEEQMKEVNVDEFASYFNKEIPPKVLLTTVDHPRPKTIMFCKEFSSSIPGGEFRYRNRSSIKSMVDACNKRGYTDIMIVNEDRREPNGLLVIHLPNGPTANFKLSSIRYRKEIKRSVNPSFERPEVIVNNFTTRLGTCIGRMLAALFHFDPNFKGRRVVTFHNQRDYIFFRNHR